LAMNVSQSRQFFRHQALKIPSELNNPLGCVNIQHGRITLVYH
ncbi:hypothetical protein TNCV_788431, partial [Trichonephila clavipes]